jgi:phage tail-like protein
MSGMMDGDEVKAIFRISGPELETDEIVVGRQGLRAGRGSDNSLVLNHREISRQHMRIIWREDDAYLVEDLNSSNGVYLNDARITPRLPQELSVGDVIRLGPYVLKLEQMVVTQRAVRRPAPPEGPFETVQEARAAESIGSINASHPPGIPRDASTWLNYLPAIFSDDDFVGRFLLIFESMMAPITWHIDNFDLYLSPRVASSEWLRWMAGWFDVLLVPELPIERQRAILEQMGWLFMRRGTRAGIQRLLELYFEVPADITEDDLCLFTVRLPYRADDPLLSSEALARRLIESQCPSFVSFRIELK